MKRDQFSMEGPADREFSSQRRQDTGQAPRQQGDQFRDSTAPRGSILHMAFESATTASPSVMLRRSLSAGRQIPSLIIPVAFPAAAVTLWIMSLGQVRLQSMSDLGLISVLPVSYFLSIAILTVGFCLFLWRRHSSTTVFLIYVGVLIAILYATPALVEQTPRFAVSWRHLGLTDYFVHGGPVRPRFDAYFNWPAFFASTALLTQIAGLTSMVNLVGWTSVAFNALFLIPLMLIYRSTTRESRLVWTGIWVFYLANWVGQDYFSPQAFAYFLYLGILGVLLMWFRGPVTRPVSVQSAWSRFQRFSPRAAQIIGGQRTAGFSVESTPWQRVGLLAIVIAAFAAMVPSHQLTPFAAIGSVTLLVLLDQITTRSLPVIMGVILLGWMSFMAISFFAGHMAPILANTGNVNQSVQTGLVGRINGSPQHTFVVNARLWMSAIVGVLAVLGGVRRLISGYRDIAMVILTIAPTPIILIPYGGEMYLRTYFYILPGLAFFAAALFFPGPSIAEVRQEEAESGRPATLNRIDYHGVPSGSSRISLPTLFLTITAVGLVTILLSAGLIVTRYGNERMDYFTPNEVAAVSYFYNHAEPGSRLFGTGFSEPWQFQGYTAYRTVWIKNHEVANDNLAAVAQRMSGNPHGDYLILTRSGIAGLQLLSGVTNEQVQQFEQSLQSSNKFKLVYQNPDARLYKFEDTGKQASTSGG